MKIILTMLIIMGCAMSGHYFARKYLIRIYILEELEQAIRFMYGEIEYSADDISEVFGQLLPHSSYLKGFWEMVRGRLLESRGQDLCSIWKEAMESEGVFALLADEDILLIEGLGKNIGSLDRQSQLGVLKLFEKRLGSIIEEAKGAYKGQAKVCHVVGVTAGIFISVLLI